MAWYRTGTVTVTNGSGTITSSGTAFIANVSIGEAFLGPDGRAYEITNVASDTSLTISPNYQGSTAGGQGYAILPARGRIADLIAETQSLLGSFASVRDGIGAGLFPDGSAATPAFRFTNDQDTGIYRVGNSILGISTNGVLRWQVDGSGNVTTFGRQVSRDDGAGMTTPMTLRNDNSSEVQTVRLAFDSSGVVKSSIRAAVFGDDYMAFHVAGDVERMRIVGNGNVGIGTSGPGTKLEVRGGHADTILQLTAAVGSGNDSYMRLLCSLPGVSFGGGALANNINGLGGSVVNTTFGSSAIHFSEDGSVQLWSGAVANIAAPRLTLAANGSSFRPNTDNVTALGSGSFRFTTVFATTGTINTSDEREKHWRGELSPAELRAAKRIIGELGIYQWNDAVAEKGEDGARLHFGVRAQRAFAIMDDEGLEWGRYAWACYDQWVEQTEPVMEEVTVTKTRKVMRPSTLIDPATGQPAMVEVDEAYEETEMQPTGETRVTLEAGDRYGVRPDQLAFWLIAAQAKIQEELEARLTALEAA